MTNPEEAVVASDSPERIMGAMDILMPQLLPETQEKLSLIKFRYWQLYGFQGLYDRVNNRTVAQILTDYNSIHDAKPIVSGKTDGVRYELYGTDESTGRGEVK